MLAARSHRPGARAEFVQSFMPMVRHVAQIYRHVPAVDRAELLQEGVVGLLRALERFNPELGTPFWAYASWWVRQAMQQLVAELSRPVVLSDRALRQLASVRATGRTFVAEQGREPTVAELASACEMTVEHLQSLRVSDRPSRGLDEPLHEAGDGGATFGDMLADPAAEEAYDELATRREVSQLPKLLGEISERELMVVTVRYGLGGKTRTLRELGQTMGVSAERVRQIEESALEKMRAAYAAGCAQAASEAATGRPPASSLAVGHGTVRPLRPAGWSDRHSGDPSTAHGPVSPRRRRTAKRRVQRSPSSMPGGVRA
ncbi:MAG: polymerase, sigma 32 subunit, RpoH [Solirubrobacterales bacterium]|nr:polymerase, sigma 32 subunit, RpoH [Solirubrobacterales bacterium]